MGWGYPWGQNKNPLAIPPGSLRSQVAIQSPSTMQDGLGGQIAQWNTVLTAMSAISTINPMSSQQEKNQNGQFISQVTHRVSIYWPGASIGIQGGMRVVFGTRTFTIQAAENVQERNRVLHLMCIEIDGAQ